MEIHALGSEGTGKRTGLKVEGRRRVASVAAASAAIVLALAAAGYFLWPGRTAPVPITAAALGMPTGPGIAVRQFNNLSDDPTLNFFGDAIAEEIVTELTRFSELRVAARAVTSEVDRKESDVKEIARKLGVEFLVQGSLRRSSERVRVNAQLLKAMDGTLLWAETYDRELTPTDMFVVQEDIASKVVAAVASISAGVIAREALGQTRGKPHAI
jgi:adenylate cyclase